jgi:phospholipid transport system substrate-binding protein
MICARKALCLLAALVAADVSAAGAAASAEEISPRATVERLINAVRSYKDSKNGALSAADQASNERAARMANSSLAIKEVSRVSLGSQWSKLSAGEQSSFVGLVTELFEKIAYPKSATFFSDLEVEYKNEKVNGDQATVATNVRHPKEGLVGIDYKLKRSRNEWVIYDILLDEVSLATDLRSQIQKVLREESYARLLERMREKLKDDS